MKLKCNSCNLVINELLAYLANKLSVADEASLVKICESTFSTNQIEEANSLLVDSLPSGLRRTERKGKGRENRMLHDIISLLKSTDPDILPVFVARDLEKLPPITFDHLDVSKFLKDLAFLQAEVRSIKASYVTTEQLQDVKNECLNLKPISPPFSAVKVNMKRGAYRDSGPRGLSELDDTFISNHANQFNCEASFPNDYNKNLKYRNINYNEGSAFECDEMSQRAAAADCRVSSVERAVERGGAGDGIASQPFNEQNGQIKVVSPKDSAKALSFAEAVQKEASGGGAVNGDASRMPACEASGQLTGTAPTYAGVTREQNLNDAWTVVRRKKSSSKNRLTGKMGNVVVESEEKFRAADKKIPLFITNVHKNTAEMDIINYIKSRTNESVGLEKISIKRQCTHDAYKLFISRSKLSLYLDVNLWPKGIIFRRFVNFKPKKAYETPIATVALKNLPVNNE